MAEQIIIVGAGIAGLATALGLHRIGIKSLVLESAKELRSSGFALTTWSNAWMALDELRIGDKLRQQHVELQGLTSASSDTGKTTFQMKLKVQGASGMHEARCVRRNLLIEALGKELPHGTIRLGAKVVSIEEDGNLKVLHLADGSILKTKVLVGCDGVNSIVAKWLALKIPLFTTRYATRGIAEYPNGHDFKHEFQQFFGDGFRSGFLPCDDKHVYWFFTWSPSKEEKAMEESPIKLKEFVLSKLRVVPPQVVEAVEKTKVDGIIASRLRLRSPTDLLWGQTFKGNVCLAGDAFHAMTPDVGQGGCSALEDGIVLARSLGEAFMAKSGTDGEEHKRIKKGIEKYVRERKWRCFELITTAYVVGVIQQSRGTVMNLVRDNLLSGVMARKLLKVADFNCGKLPILH